jgi:hypothetical protein
MRRTAELAATVLLLAAPISCTIAGNAGDSTGTRSGDGVSSEDEVAAAEAEATRFVGPGGNDAADGRAGRPWATLAHALPQLEPGDVLVVQAGEYRERLRGLRLQPGTSDQPVHVRAADGQRPVVRGLVWLERPSYWTFSGLNVTWDDERNSSKEHMVKISNGVGWTWRESELWGARSPAALLVVGDRAGEPDGWSISGNCIHDTVPTNGPAQDNNIYIGDMERPGRGTIEKNLVFGAPNGRNIKLGDGTSSQGAGPSGVRVVQNTLAAAIVPIAVAGGTSHTDIERNILAYGSSGYLVRGFELTGGDNRVSNNVGFGASAFVGRDPGALQVGYNQLLVDTGLLSGMGSCNDFRPTAAAPAGYGHLG